MSAEVLVGRAGLPLCRSGQRWRPAHLCGEVIPALQTPPKQKALWSAERGGRGGRERRRRAGGRGGRLLKGRRLSRFIARSREASTEHSFNQTVTSPPGAAQRLENRSLLGSVPCLRFCSHTSPQQQRAQRRERRHLFFLSKRE